MDIYVVQPGDTIDLIADRFDVTVARLIQDNELINPYNLVPGQTIVITHPITTHTVVQGESLKDISQLYGVTLMQLLRNNPYLYDRQYIYPDEVIVISYNTKEQITTNGFAYPFINEKSLLKTLPYLTYLSIFNYRAAKGGEIVAYYDETELIRTAKLYGVAPLMVTSSLSIQGAVDVQIAYDILLSDEYQDNLINNILSILKAKGYYGVNMTLSYVNTTNEKYYNHFMTKVSNRIRNEGFLFTVTINPNINYVDNQIPPESVNYSVINQTSNNLLFMQFIWGINSGPPLPVSSITKLRVFLDYVIKMISPEKTNIGQAIIGFDWELPFMEGKSKANSLTLDSCITLAKDNGVVIQFDEISQTPYFTYENITLSATSQHIVWFIDARSINALLNLLTEYHLDGTGIWNIMVYYAQLWLIINSQYSIEKILPEI